MGKKTVVAIGSDHAGFILKESLKEFLNEKNFEVIDVGTNSEASVDYPDFAQEVARGVSKGKYERGVLICGTGIGMAISANRFPKARAALVTSPFHAEMAAKHNKANILVFGSKITSTNEAIAMLKIWLETEYEGGRHDRRLEKIDKFKS